MKPDAFKPCPARQLLVVIMEVFFIRLIPVRMDRWVDSFLNVLPAMDVVAGDIENVEIVVEFAHLPMTGCSVLMASLSRVRGTAWSAVEVVGRAAET